MWVLTICTNYALSIVLPGMGRNSNGPAVAVMHPFQEKHIHSNEKNLARLSTDEGRLRLYIPEPRINFNENYYNGINDEPNLQSSLQNIPSSRTRSYKETVGQSNFYFPNPLFDDSQNHFQKQNSSSTNPHSPMKEFENVNINLSNENIGQDETLHDSHQIEDSEYIIRSMPKNIHYQPPNTLRENYSENNNPTSSENRVLRKVQKVPLVLITIRQENSPKYDENPTSYFNVEQIKNINIGNNTNDGKNFPKYRDSNLREAGQLALSSISQSHINSENIKNQKDLRNHIKIPQQDRKKFEYSVPMPTNKDRNEGVWTPMELKSYKVSEEILGTENQNDINGQHMEYTPASQSMPHYILSSNSYSHSKPSYSLLLYVSEPTHSQNPSDTHSHKNEYNTHSQTNLQQNVPILTNFNTKVMIPLVHKATKENLSVGDLEQKSTNEDVISAYENNSFGNPTQYTQVPQYIQVSRQVQIPNQRLSSPVLASSTAPTKQYITSLMNNKQVDYSNIMYRNFEHQIDDSKPSKSLAFESIPSGDQSRTFREEFENFERQLNISNQNKTQENHYDEIKEHEYPVQLSSKAINRPRNYYDGYVIFPQE